MFAKDGGVSYVINSDDDILKENISKGKKAIISLIEKAKVSSNPEELVIKNAMYRRDIGYIDFVWGKPGVGPKFKRGFGLSHIISKRNSEGKNGIEIANKIVEVIAKSTVYREQSNDFAQEHFIRMILEYKGYTAVLSKNKNDNSWLLTGWENEKAESSAYEEVNDSFDATTTMPTRTRHSGDDSASYDTTVPQKTQSVNSSISENSENDTNSFTAMRESIEKRMKAKGLNVTYDPNEANSFYVPGTDKVVIGADATDEQAYARSAARYTEYRGLCDRDRYQ